jgi:hypothetical protein
MSKMYIKTWTKYLPIIKILLKRSIAGEQIFNLNVSDFILAGATRKVGYKFSIHFIDGKVDNLLNTNIARDLATALLEDVHTKEILTLNNFQISMNAKFQLNIKFTGKTTNEQQPANESLMSEEVLES